MKKLSLPIFVIVMILSACASVTETPPPTAELIQPTSTVPQPTQTPLPTNTPVPTIEIIIPTETLATQSNSGAVSFANQVLPIFQTYCIECHGGQRTREGLNMTTYDLLIAGSINGTVLVPGNANDSLFIQLIQEGEMPNRGVPPSSEELQILIDWVNQGALNN